MRIRWNNILALILALVALNLMTRNWNAIRVFFRSLHAFGPYHTPDERFIGFMAAGLIAACIIAIIKILKRGA